MQHVDRLLSRPHTRSLTPAHSSAPACSQTLIAPQDQVFGKATVYLDTRSRYPWQHGLQQLACFVRAVDIPFVPQCNAILLEQAHQMIGMNMREEVSIRLHTETVNSVVFFYASAMLAAEPLVRA